MRTEAFPLLSAVAVYAFPVDRVAVTTASGAVVTFSVAAK